MKMRNEKRYMANDLFFLDSFHSSALSPSYRQDKNSRNVGRQQSLSAS
jgi:hypothetical protein